MQTLAIDCATEACSAALFDDGTMVAGFCEVLGRGHAEQLIPRIADLPGKGRAERILVSLGPGSFTGVRIGIAAARALGLAWGAQVLGYPTLALVAAIARHDPATSGDQPPVTVCMTGGHGEWFVQDFDPQGLPETQLASLRPDQAGARGSHAVIAGSKAAEFADLLSDDAIVAVSCLPDARRALLVPDAMWSADLTPRYGRPPDARPQDQRA